MSQGQEWGEDFGIQVFGGVLPSLLTPEMGRKGGKPQEKELAEGTAPSVHPMSLAHLLPQLPQRHQRL